MNSRWSAQAEVNVSVASNGLYSTSLHCHSKCSGENEGSCALSTFQCSRHCSETFTGIRTFNPHRVHALVRWGNWGTSEQYGRAAMCPQAVWLQTPHCELFISPPWERSVVAVPHGDHTQWSVWKAQGNDILEQRGVCGSQESWVIVSAPSFTVRLETSYTSVPWPPCVHSSAQLVCVCVCARARARAEGWNECPF